MGLRNFTPFKTPLTRDLLQNYRSPVLDLQARLRESYGGGGLYLPFYEHGGRELRATQAYMAKFPAQMVLLSGLDGLRGRAAASAVIEPSRRSRRAAVTCEM